MSMESVQPGRSQILHIMKNLRFYSSYSKNIGRFIKNVNNENPEKPPIHKMSHGDLINFTHKAPPPQGEEHTLIVLDSGYLTHRGAASVYKSPGNLDVLLFEPYPGYRDVKNNQKILHKEILDHKPENAKVSVHSEFLGTQLHFGTCGDHAVATSRVLQKYHDSIKDLHTNKKPPNNISLFSDRHSQIKKELIMHTERLDPAREFAHQGDADRDVLNHYLQTRGRSILIQRKALLKNIKSPNNQKNISGGQSELSKVEAAQPPFHAAENSFDQVVHGESRGLPTNEEIVEQSVPSTSERTVDDRLRNRKNLLPLIQAGETENSDLLDLIEEAETPQERNAIFEHPRLDHHGLALLAQHAESGELEKILNHSKTNNAILYSSIVNAGQKERRFIINHPKVQNSSLNELAKTAEFEERKLILQHEKSQDGTLALLAKNSGSLEELLHILNDPKAGPNTVIAAAEKATDYRERLAILKHPHVSDVALSHLAQTSRLEEERVKIKNHVKAGEQTKQAFYDLELWETERPRLRHTPDKSTTYTARVESPSSHFAALKKLLTIRTLRQKKEPPRPALSPAQLRQNVHDSIYEWHLGQLEKPANIGRP